MNLRLYYYNMIMSYDALYTIFSAHTNFMTFCEKLKYPREIMNHIKKTLKPKQHHFDWYFAVEGKEYDERSLSELANKVQFYTDKYKELSEVEPKEDGKNTINDMIVLIEAILGININRELPVSSLDSYLKQAKKQSKNERHKGN